MRKVLLVVLLVVTGCTDEKEASRALRNAGLVDINITGWDAFGCGDDWSCTGFTATQPNNGARVTGAVGCGLILKNCTVRW